MGNEIESAMKEDGDSGRKGRREVAGIDEVLDDREMVALI